MFRQVAFRFTGREIEHVLVAVQIPFQFRGGKGFASLLGFSLALDWRMLLVCLALVGILLNAVLPGNDYQFGKDLQGDTSVNFKV